MLWIVGPQNQRRAAKMERTEKAPLFPKRARREKAEAKAEEKAKTRARTVRKAEKEKENELRKADPKEVGVKAK